MVSGALLLVAVVLTAQLCAGTAYAGSGGDGFSVEFIHRDSVRSPFHDPTLTAPARVLEAARRSAARAAALSRSYVRADAPSADGVVSEVTSRSSEYLMAVNIGTPPTPMVAIADTGSDLIWLNCSYGDDGPGPATAGAASAQPRGVQFDPSKSTTFSLVDCDSGACGELPDAACGTDSKCRYSYSYGDGSHTSGVLSTETFTFAAPGGRGDGTTRLANVNFGCSTTFVGTFIGDGLVGLGGGDLSLVSQLGAHTFLGRRFSYCLVPYSVMASSALNFGSRAGVTDSRGEVGNKTFPAPDQSPIIVDSGTTLTYLPEALLDPLVKELTRRIKLPPAQSPEKFLPLCFDVSGVREGQLAAMIPDVTLGLGGGAAVTLKAENTFVEVQEGTLCLAVAAMSEQLPASIIGNIAQQNMHVGYDLDKGTVTFAPADCASSYPAPTPSGSV
uniref:Aspartic proteinase nepenthesin-2 n=1 Tax=Aegilops tauschii TaxID=37682 RepID=M8B3M0_AEGTA